MTFVLVSSADGTSRFTLACDGENVGESKRKSTQNNEVNKARVVTRDSYSPLS